MRGAVLFAQEFSPFSLQLKKPLCVQKADGHRVKHLAHLSAPEGCSQNTGELYTVPPGKEGPFLPTAVLGTLSRISCNVSIFAH